MTIDSFDALYLTLAFLVPGFIIQSTIAISLPRREDPIHLSFLRFLTFSCVNYAIWSWLIFAVHNVDFFTDSPWRTARVWFIIILVGPAIEGLLLGWCRRTELGLRLLQRFGLSPIHPIPTAWDFKFSGISSERYVIVTLNDGSQIHGLFAHDSFASDVAGDRDLFLEKTYRKTDESWEDVTGQDGILLTSNQIRHIEFIKGSETNP